MESIILKSILYLMVSLVTNLIIWIGGALIISLYTSVSTLVVVIGFIISTGIMYSKLQEINDDKTNTN